MSTPPSPNNSRSRWFASLRARRTPNPTRLLKPLLFFLPWASAKDAFKLGPYVAAAYKAKYGQKPPLIKIHTGKDRFDWVCGYRLEDRALVEAAVNQALMAAAKQVS